MIVFGGANCFTAAYNDIWILSNANGLGGVPAWTQRKRLDIRPCALTRDVDFD
jgi:hypothetical protein